MPAVMTTDAERYGLIGAAFGMVSWLFAAALLLVVTAALGARWGAGGEASSATARASPSGRARPRRPAELRRLTMGYCAAMSRSVGYAWNNEFALAYEVVGEGAVDLLLLAGAPSNLDVQWESPAYAAFLRGLAEGRRLIITDRRGTGLSDRFSPSAIQPIESLTDDLLRRWTQSAAAGRGDVVVGDHDGRATVRGNASRALRGPDHDRSGRGLAPHAGHAMAAGRRPAGGDAGERTIAGAQAGDGRVRRRPRRARLRDRRAGPGRPPGAARSLPPAGTQPTGPATRSAASRRSGWSGSPPVTSPHSSASSAGSPGSARA